MQFVFVSDRLRTAVSPESQISSAAESRRLPPERVASHPAPRGILPGSRQEILDRACPQVRERLVARRRVGESTEQVGHSSQRCFFDDAMHLFPPAEAGLRL
jgi:hypothetical protein